MLDNEKIAVDQFKGIWANYDTESIPLGHFKDAINYQFLAGGPCKIRNGIALATNIDNGFNIKRIKRFEIPGQDDHIIALDNSGDLYDLNISTATPIHSTGSGSDFCGVSLYGRFYFSYSDGKEGIQDDVVYVYDPNASPTVRAAAGPPPNDFELAGSSVAAQLVASVANAQSFSSGVALTLTSSPFVPTNPNTIKITLVKGTSTITAMTITVVGKDAGGDAQTKAYVSKVLSAGPLTYTTFEEWSSITSITPSAITGSIGTATLAVATTGKPPGKIERGYHVIALAYETDSGYITAPGPSSGSGKTINVNFLVFLVTKDKRVLTITGIPASPPSGTAKIHILASKAIVKKRYTGNPNDYELFFVPKTSGGEVAVGTTTATINFFDADLVASADFLKDNLSQLPAGVAMIATSTGRLGIMGVNSTSSVVPVDPDAPGNPPGNNTVLWMSKGGEPESISATDGFVIVKPGGEGLRNSAEYRGLIYLYKQSRTYATQDNGDLPSTWEIQSIDNSVGADSHSVSVSLGADSSTNDQIIVGARSGLELFTGTYAERNLSWKIKEIWDSINDADFYLTEIANDPTNNLLYVICKTSTDSKTHVPDTILFGDYNEGLDSENIKWSKWQISDGTIPAYSILTRSTDAGVLLNLASGGGNLYSYTYGDNLVTDDGDEITNSLELWRMRYTDDGGVSQIVGYRARVLGNGTLTPTIYGPEDATSVTLASTALTTSVVNNIWIPTNVVVDSGSLKLVLTGTNRSLLISYIWVYGNAIWTTRPA